MAIRLFGIGRVRVETNDPAPGVEDEVGILPCDFAECSERTGIACDHIDRRRRLCATAWCPDHRHVINGRAFCAIHAAQHAAMMDPATSRPEAVLAWLSAAAEDDIVALLNEVAARNGAAMVVAEAMRNTGDAAGERRWIRTWSVRHRTGMKARVTLSNGETHGDTVFLGVDNVCVRILEIPPAQLMVAAGAADLDWLMREVAVPIRLALAGAGVGESDTDLAGHRRVEASAAAPGGIV